MPRLDLSLNATAGLAFTRELSLAEAGSGRRVSDSSSMSEFLLRLDLNSALITSPGFNWRGAGVVPVPAAANISKLPAQTHEAVNTTMAAAIAKNLAITVSPFDNCSSWGAACFFWIVTGGCHVPSFPTTATGHTIIKYDCQSECYDIFLK
jgi:hypothetical protein